MIITWRYIILVNQNGSLKQYPFLLIQIQTQVLPWKCIKVKAYLNSERQIHCYDLLTGELVWEQNFEGNFQFSGFAIGDSMLVGNCNEANTYGVDPDTG